MRKQLPLVIAMALWLLSPIRSLACSAFYSVNDSLALAAKNLDSDDPHTRITFMARYEGGNGWMFFSKSDGFPQGGMNEQGLFWEGASTRYREIQLAGSSKQQYTGVHIMQKVMEECATVAEAIAIFSEYYFLDLLDAQYLIGDRFGGAAVIEGDVITRIEGDTQIITNFNYSDIGNFGTTEGIACARYRITHDMLSSGELSLDLMRRTLAATHQELEGATTLYSTIFDLRNLRVHIYHFHNYENGVVLDLMEELERGAHVLQLPALFPATFAAEEYMRRYDLRRQHEYRVPRTNLILMILILFTPLVIWVTKLGGWSHTVARGEEIAAGKPCLRSLLARSWLLLFALFGMVSGIIYLNRAELIEEFLNSGGVIQSNGGDMAVTWLMTIGATGLLLLSILVWRIPRWTTLERVVTCLVAAVFCNFMYLLDSLTLLMWT